MRMRTSGVVLTAQHSQRAQSLCFTSGCNCICSQSFSHPCTQPLWDQRYSVFTRRDSSWTNTWPGFTPMQ